MPRAQQHYAYKGPPYAQRIRNFVVTHVRVVAHHQRHPRSRSQFVQRLAHFFASALLDQPVELARVRVLQRNTIHVFGLFVLPDLPPTQHVPAMVCRHLIQPCRKRPALVVLAQLIPELHENFHGGVFRIFARRQSPSAKPENRRSVLPIELPPGLAISGLGPGDCFSRLDFTRGAHSAWSQRFHRLIRSKAPKTYTNVTTGDRYPVPTMLGATSPCASTVAEIGYLAKPHPHTRWKGRPEPLHGVIPRRNRRGPAISPGLFWL